MLKRWLKKNLSETIRDITAFGNPLILVILAAFVLGINLILIKMMLGLISVELFCTFIKISYHRKRPNREKYASLLEKVDAGSFPSLHAARSAFILLGLFFITPSYLIKMLAILVVILVATSRVLLKKHYLSDVIIGLLVGLAFSLVWINFVL